MNAQALDAYVKVAERATTCPNCQQETLCRPRIEVVELDRRRPGQQRRMNGIGLTFSCDACPADIWVNLKRTEQGGWIERWNWRIFPAEPSPSVTPVLDRSWADLEIPF